MLDISLDFYSFFHFWQIDRDRFVPDSGKTSSKFDHYCSSKPCGKLTDLIKKEIGSPSHWQELNHYNFTICCVLTITGFSSQSWKPSKIACTFIYISLNSLNFLKWIDKPYCRNFKIINFIFNQVEIHYS